MLMFYDIETLTANTGAKPSELQPIEYIVALTFRNKRKQEKLFFPNLYQMIEYLLKSKLAGKYTLIAHNSDKFDTHFLFRSLIKNYGLTPHSAYTRNTTMHDLEYSQKEFKGDYLLETRVKSKTSLRLDFRINGIKFNTDDTAPKFQASISTIGKLLYHGGIINKSDEKLHYEYDEFDTPEKFEYPNLVKYAYNVYKNLNSDHKQYVFNDVNILYTAYYHYNDIFPKFNIKKRTLSGNILDAYNTSKLSDLQLLNNFDKQKINLTNYTFENMTFYDYIHRYYKGGLNLYNNRYIAKKVKDCVHIDLNSSYPTAMYYKLFPTYLVSYGRPNETIERDPDKYYMIEVDKQEFNKWLKLFKSSVLKTAFVKYFANNYENVYLSSPHISLIEKIIGKPFNPIVTSYCEWETEPFAARDTIKQFYDDKVNGKKQGWSYGEIYVTKVKLNGIYGIPALRAYFNIFRRDEDGNYINDINGFANTQRNIVFASAVTAYAFYALLEPLTVDVARIDYNFIYADTDSLFLKRKFFDEIKQDINIDKYQLGAWDEEHSYVEQIYVLNHKKYAYFADGEIIAKAGGITDGTFNLNMSFDDFIATQFHDGAKFTVLRHSLTKDLVMALYNAETEIKSGVKYPTSFKFSDELNASITKFIVSNDLDSGDNIATVDALYVETPFGTFSQAEIYDDPQEIELADNIDLLVEKYKEAKEFIK